jgi:hypothetical protein
MKEVIFKNKLKWEIVSTHKSPWGVAYYKYRVLRKHYGVWFSSTKQTYLIFPHVFEYYAERLKKDSNFYYTRG